MLDVQQLTLTERRALRAVLEEKILATGKIEAEDGYAMMGMWTLLRRAEQDKLTYGPGEMRVRLSVLNMGGGNVEYEILRVSLTEAVLRGAGSDEPFTMAIDDVENTWTAASGIKYRPILWREVGGPWVEYNPVRALDPVPGLDTPGVKLPIVQENDDSIRAAGPSDACFYCRAKVGTEHTIGCPCIKKLVRVRYSFELPIEFPFAWDDETARNYLNHSSWCASNALDELAEYDKRHGCLCDVFTAEVVGAAIAGPYSKVRQEAKGDTQAQQALCFQCGRGVPRA